MDGAFSPDGMPPGRPAEAVAPGGGVNDASSAAASAAATDDGPDDGLDDDGPDDGLDDDGPGGDPAVEVGAAEAQPLASSAPAATAMRTLTCGAEALMCL